jgi:transposase
MLIIECDFHTPFQQIAMVDTTSGEITERREARAFYVALPGPARVGMEATIATQWFETMLSEYGHELWFGHAAEIRAAMVRKQKTDTRDALHILDLLLTIGPVERFRRKSKQVSVVSRRRAIVMLCER